MQQVKSEAFLAGARPVDYRALPVPVRTSRNRLANRFGRAWVLHGKIMRRGIMAMVLAGLAIVGFQLREPAGFAFTGAVEMAQAKFAVAGFAIGEISITGQTLTSEQDIFDALGIVPNTPTFGFDVEAARARVAKLPAVETVSVRKTYPADIAVVLTEKVPVARWRVDGVTFVIDAHGEQIGEDRGAYGDLPLVIGDGAADDALAMIRALNTVPQLEDGLIAISRIADRRWDLIYETGLRIQLPEQGVAQALRKVVSYQNQFQILDRDISILDLRIDNLVAIRPNKTEEEAGQS